MVQIQRTNRPEDHLLAPNDVVLTLFHATLFHATHTLILLCCAALSLSYLGQMLVSPFDIFLL
jgi:hypothetical protein